MRTTLLLVVLVCFCCSSSWGDDTAAPGAAKSSTILFEDPLGKVEVGLPPMEVQFESSQREVVPKLIRELRLVCKDGPAAVLVSTRIRDELPKDDRVLERLEPKYKNFQAEHGKEDVLLELRGASPHRTLEFVVSGGEYQDAFPYVVGGHIGLDDPPKSITISQFYVTKSRLFEVAIYLPNADKATKADLFTKARKLCDQWRERIAVLP